jgi:hypothetical protein
MAAAFPVTFTSFWYFAVAVTMSLVAIGIAGARRPKLPRLSALLALVAMVCLALAAGQPVWHRPELRTISVMVDLSPSTRGAHFRNNIELKNRLSELLGDTPYQLFAFSDRNFGLNRDRAFPELPCKETIFSPVNGDAIILFSDAQFRVPATGPPTFVVVDPGLENVSDARVDRLELHGSKVFASITNTGRPRVASFMGMSGPAAAAVDTGRTVVNGSLADGARFVAAGLNPDDLWPENDSLAVYSSPPIYSERWWVGDNPPDKTWRHFKPSELPEDFARFLAPSIIVLNNVDAPSLGRSTINRINHYAGTLDGTLLIIGGDHAYIGGDYFNSELDFISPLAMWPAIPGRQWVLLVDGSGSMARTVNGTSLFKNAANALVHMLPRLPIQESISIGQFSDSIQWWFRPNDQMGRTPNERILPPPDAEPSGPTDLEDVLNRVGSDADPTGLTEFLLFSDCDAHIDDPQHIIDTFKRQNVRLHVLALGAGSGLPALRKIVQDTGGTIQEQFDPAQWLATSRTITPPPQFFRTPTTVKYLDEAESLGTEKTSAWNRLWLKGGATMLAQTSDIADPLPMAATWPVVGGHVVATAFIPSVDQIQRLAHLCEHAPRDPRFTVRWDIGRDVKVTIDAVDNGEFMDDLHLHLAVPGDETTRLDVPQIAPGRYEAILPSQTQRNILSLRNGDTLVDSRAMAARYPPEFDALGNNHDAMNLLAQRTDGQVIEPTDHGPIDFHWPGRDVDLTPILCTGAAALLAVAAIRWRLV